MRKIQRTLCALVALALCLSGVAYAATPVDNVVLAVNDGNFCVMVGANNYLYRSDSVAPLCEFAVRSVLYADMSRIVFSTVDEEHQHEFAEGASVLWQLNINDGDEDPTPRAFANIIGEAVYVPADAAIYFVMQDDKTELLAYHPYEGAYTETVAFHQEITGLSASVNGLVIYGDGDAYLYNAAQAAITAIDNPPVYGSIKAYEAFETRLDGDGCLSIGLKGKVEGTVVDDNVAAVTAAGGIVYYIRNLSGQYQLCCYNYGDSTATVLSALAESMLPEMVSDGFETVYMLGASHQIYRYHVTSRVVDTIYTIADGVDAPVLCYAAPDLIVYDGNSEDGTEAYVTTIEVAAPAVETEQPTVEGTPEPFVQQPAVEATPEPAQSQPESVPADLTKGSRGDDVRALQQILKDQGYPVGSVDGIFGAGTRKAVRYLQWDMGVHQSGTVSHEFLMALESSTDLPTFSWYVEVKEGEQGIRVSDMQSRLKALGWLSGKADGDFGSSTKKALERFQKAAGLSADGIAGVHTLKKLYSKSAPKYTPPAPKATGGSNPDYVDDDYIVHMVRWMNNNLNKTNFGRKTAIYALQCRLVQLGYMAKRNVTKVYDETTWLAVKRFQNDNDLLPHPTGNPDTKTLEAMFASARAMYMR